MSNSKQNILNVRHAFLESLFKTAVDAIVVIDDRGKILESNPSTSQLFGFTMDEMRGQNVSMLMPTPYREEHDGYLKHYRDTGVRKIIGVGREVIGKRKDGSTFPMHLAVSETEFDSRRMFVGIVRDISDLKDFADQLIKLNGELEERVQQRTAELREAQSELIRKEKLATLGEVSGGIAHEIRNPLNVVKTSVYYLVNAKNPTPEKFEEHLGRIDRQVTLIDNVVTALSDVARLPDPNLSPCKIKPMIDGIAGSTTLPPEIRIDNQLSEDLPDVLVDSNQIPIVFRNLLRNARDAMPDGGTITITGDVKNERLQIHVIDEGTGIEHDQISKIMEPLYSTKARGMGLGLAISKTIVEKNKGTLTVESTLGVRTTFTVELPTA